MSATLVARALVKRFATSEPVLVGVDLMASPGRFLAVRGLPASGRTTLLRCLSGAYRPSAGSVEVRLDGAMVDGNMVDGNMVDRNMVDGNMVDGNMVARDSLDLATADARTLAWLRSHHVAAFDGALAAPPSQRAAAAVARAGRVHAVHAVSALRRLGLAAVADQQLGRLRPAQRRGVALAAALVSPACVLLLDEPDTAADPLRVADWVSELVNAGSAVVATTSPGSSIEAAATAVADLHEGKLQCLTP